MMAVNDNCNCPKMLLDNKYFKRNKNCTKAHCIYCIDLENEDEAIRIFLLKRKLIGLEILCREHMDYLKPFVSDINESLILIKDLNQLDNCTFNVVEIEEKICEMELKFLNLFSTICMKRARNYEKSAEYFSNTDFLLPQVDACRNKTERNGFCASCSKDLEGKDFDKNLKWGQSDFARYKQFCNQCQDTEDSNTIKKKHIIQYLDLLHIKFSKKKIEFEGHMNDLKYACLSAQVGMICLATFWEQCVRDSADIKKIINKVFGWEYKLKSIDMTVCKTKGPGKPHNTILLQKHEWDHETFWIYKYIHETFYMVRNGQKVYAMCEIENIMKFGAFSSDVNHLFLHAITLDTAEDDAYYLKLSDLKICAKNVDFYPFITINCNELGTELRFIIRLHDCHLSSKFIQLCTGEKGVSYKNSSYVRSKTKNDLFETVLYVQMSHLNNVEKSYKFDPSALSYTEIKGFSKLNEYKKGDLFLIGYRDGSFAVYRSLSDDLKIETIGEVISKDKFSQIDDEDIKHFKIVDCGIQILHF